MTAYALIMTLFIGITIGVAGTVAFAEWLETRDWNRYRARKAQQDATDVEMDQAAELIMDAMPGTTILSYEKN